MTNTPYNHFENGKGDGFIKEVKNTNFLKGNLQITDQKNGYKGVIPAGIDMISNTTLTVPKIISDYSEEVGERIGNIINGLWESFRHPKESMKENGGFWKTTGKNAGNVISGVSGVALVTASQGLSIPAKLYEGFINNNIQTLAKPIHWTADKVENLDIPLLSKLTSRTLNGLANGAKITSKSLGYISTAYAFNYFSRILNNFTKNIQNKTLLNNQDKEVPTLSNNSLPTEDIPVGNNPNYHKNAA